MDALPHYSQYMAKNPCRRPDWRWQRAQRLIEQHQYVTRGRDDALTAHAVRYLRSRARRRNTSAKVGNQFSAVHEAHQIHEQGGTTQLMLQARLLARQTSAEIASLTGVPAEVIDSYEALFFCCRAHLNAHDWVTTQLIGCPAEPDAGTVLKLFAYHGGPHVLDAVAPYLVGTRDLFEPGLDLSMAAGRLEQKVRLAVAAQMLPVDASTDMKLLKIMLLLRETDHKCPKVPAPMSIFARNVDTRLEEVLAGAPERQVDAQDTEQHSTAAAPFGQTA